MFEFTRTSNLFNAQNVYLSTGPRNDDVIYLVCFCPDGSVRSYVA